MSERNKDDAERYLGFDVLGLLRAHGRTAAVAAMLVAAGVFVFGWVYLQWWQPVQTITALEFRPTFRGADGARYPNELPYSVTDVTAGPIVDLVYDRSEIGNHCGREEFRAGFFVEHRSNESMYLDLEYQSRLSEPRITAVERRMLQEEHESKSQALPQQYRLMFVPASACEGIPQTVVAKVLTEVLETWASESENKRGVLKHQVEVLTPGVFDVTVGGAGGAILRADLVRAALDRVIANVDLVVGIPGANLIRLGEERIAFAEVRAKLDDLARSKLEPLVMTAGRSLARESLFWVNETVAMADRDQRAAEGEATAYRNALREYSGTSTARSAEPAQRPGVAPNQNSGSPQTVLPQIDDAFIDRILDMSAASVLYRQQLTDAMVRADVNAVKAQQRASYYRRLLQAQREPGGVVLSAEQIESYFAEITREAKALTKQFNDLYDEFSRVSLRASGAMYKIEKAVMTEQTRQFTRSDLLRLVLLALAASFALVLGVGAFRDRLKVASH
jgi:hypothetical protein